MKAGKPVAFILLAFVIGATVSQGSFAFADDSSTNPFRAIWDAIGELQVKTESLQAQIDDLRSQQGTTVSAQAITKNSESSLAIDVTPGQSGQTLVTLIVRNAGPDSAVGVKLTTFYQTSLFQINFVQGAECSDGSRGIIECYLGTIVAGSEARVVVDATPIIIGQQAIITADLSSITTDANLANNHAETVFITSVTPVSQPAAPSAPVEIPPVEQPPAEQQASEEQPTEQSQEGEQGTEEVSEEQPAEQTSEQSDGSESTENESSDASSGDEGTGTSDSEVGDSEAAGAGTGSDEGSVGDTGTGDSGGDTGTEGSESNGTGASSDTGSEGGSSDSSGSDGGSTGDAGSSGSDGSSDGGSSGDGSSSSGNSGSDGGSTGGDSGSTG